MDWAIRFVACLVFVAPAFACASGTTATEPANIERYREWTQSMKTAERGPFRQLRWFCNDGSVFPPRPYACSDHGGGYQHGEWSEQTTELRHAGYYIANLLAGVNPEAFMGHDDSPERYAQLLIERFLVGADDGWILRRALFYRGAIQEEDERDGARELLGFMSDDAYWSGPGFVALRTGFRLLPHSEDTGNIDRVRSLAASVSDRDPGFGALRAKIHGSPDAGDAERVRAYAAASGQASLADDYTELADAIDAAYAPVPMAERIDALLADSPPEPLKGLLEFARQTYIDATDDTARLEAGAALLVAIRRGFQDWPGQWRLGVMDLGIAVERDVFVTATRLRAGLSERPRAELVGFLAASLDAAYGTGLVNGRLRGAAWGALASLDASTVALPDYRQALGYLGRAPGWATQAMRMHFFESMQKMAELEPMAMRFIQDQLRGSPMLLFADVLDILSRDAGALAGVHHDVFGEDVGTGFNALNPGIARGVLRIQTDLDDIGELAADGVYVLPETVSDLPPVRGILTAGEGNPLSHVQLLARNLGIPNAAVDERMLAELRPHAGKPVVYAVSRAGLVSISLDGPEWDGRLGSDEQGGRGVIIHPDLDKLDLSEQRFLPLDELRASDSGRVVGPKAAKLGELRQAYPQAVANGVAIPFGVFKRVALDRPHPDFDGSIYEWMVEQYNTLGPIDHADAATEEAYEAFRAELYDLVLSTPLDAAFRGALDTRLAEVFGGTPPGLFVRSDTNVEDLAGFTGAGLNLTLPNVLPGDAFYEAIRRVWASPFTARAFAWRQSHMSEPEHVYTSLLLLQSVASDKSGVMVTADLDSGDTGTLSVAVNEGVGGAVDGQAAESLRIDRASGDVRVLATATAPWKREPSPGGGIKRLRASGADVVLQPSEIRQLIELTDSLPERFPPITDDEGNPAPADIEFGFVDGQLRLFQLRPFLQSRAAQGNAWLEAMDRSLADGRDRQVDMKAAPR